MRNLIVPTGFAAAVLAITWMTARAECKESVFAKEAQNAATSAASSEARSAEQQLINKATHKGVAPAGLEKKGLVETPGMEKKGVLSGAGTHGFKNETKQLLKEEENKGVNKLIDEGTSGTHKKGW